MTHTKIVKISFFVVAALFSFLTWIQFNMGLDPIGSSEIIFSAFMLVLTVGFFIASMFIFSKRTVLVEIVIYLLVYVLILGFRPEQFLAASLALLIFYYSVGRLKASLDNSIKVKVRPAILFGAPTTVTAMAILFAFASYVYPFNFSEIKISQNAFSFAAPFATGIIKTQVPFYEDTMTLDQIFAIKLVSDGTVDLTKANLSKDALNILISNAATMKSDPEAFLKNEQVQKVVLPEVYSYVERSYKKQLKDNIADLEDRLSITLTGQETITDIMTLVANSYIEKYAKPNQRVVPIFVALAVFLSIKSLGFFINRISILFSWIILTTLVKLGAVVKEVEQVERETLLI